MTALLPVVEYRLLVMRSMWRTTIVGTFVTPVVFLLALGVGLGSLVDANSTQLGVPYLAFVAPAMLCSSTLILATSEATFPVMAGFKWVRTFHGITSTPVSPARLADGLVVWIVLRQLVNAAVFLAFVAAFGGTQRWWVLLAVPAAVLSATAFAAPVLALAASVSSEGQAFNVLFRFVVTPMFLFSGTFYPIERLPVWGQVLAHVTPLWHGTELARGAALGHLDALDTLGHVGYLLLWLVAGVGLARWRFRVRVAA